MISAFFNRIFPLINDAALGARMDPLRAEVAGAARGRVLEIGAGSGLNFRHYDERADVVAVEPAANMRARAIERSAQRAGDQAGPRATITIVEGRARSLPFDAGSFDTVLITFTLCSVRDVGAALTEVARVLKPGGEVRLLEHTVSADERGARVQQIMEPAWNVVFGGCSLLRDPRADLERAGFDPRGLSAIDLPLPFPVRAGVKGVAIKA